MRQFLITPSAGKRLIAKALVIHPAVQNVLRNGTLVVIAGTTNGYVVEEIFRSLQVAGFSKDHFFRGIVLPPSKPVTLEGRVQDESKFPGDVIIVNGSWQKGKTLADVVDSLKNGDVIIKGANALNLERKQAAVLVGHPKAGTIGLILPVVAGRRVKLIVAVGLEKRVNGDLYVLAQELSEPSSSGYRLVPVMGEVFSELDAIKALTQADAKLLSAGGVVAPKVHTCCLLQEQKNKKQ